MIYGCSEEAKNFITVILENRWESIKHVFQELPSWNDQNFCHFKSVYTTEQFKSRFAGEIKEVKEALDTCQGLETSIKWKDVRAIRDLEVADFIETIAAEAVGAENVFAFFRRCF